MRIEYLSWTTLVHVFFFFFFSKAAGLADRTTGAANELCSLTYDKVQTIRTPIPMSALQPMMYNIMLFPTDHVVRQDDIKRDGGSAEIRIVVPKESSILFRDCSPPLRRFSAERGRISCRRMGQSGSSGLQIRMNTSVRHHCFFFPSSFPLLLALTYYAARVAPAALFFLSFVALFEMTN